MIPTMNRPESLERTLKSYLSGTAVPSQIVVVDQSQTEEIRKKNQAALSRYCHRVKWNYCFQKEASITKARNIAMGYAENEIMVFSDDDVDIYQGTLCNVVSLMQDSTLALIAGIDDNAFSPHGFIGYIFGTKSFLRRKEGHVTPSMLGRYPAHVIGEVPTQWAMGYFFVVRKSLVQTCCLAWDEKLTSYAYAEDLDFSLSYCKASRERGMRCILSDQVRVKHLASQEYRVPSRKSTFMYVINRSYLSYKHHTGVFSRLLMNWTNLGVLMMRVVKRENPGDMLQAIIREKQVLQALRAGRIEPAYYE